MELFQYSGFQTVEFALTVILAARLFLSRSLTSSFLVGWLTLAAAGVAGLHYANDQIPALPFFVSGWRILVTVFGAALLGEIVEEWRGSPGGHSTAHFVGLAITLVGTGLVWWNNFVATSTALLMAGFVLLGYCARENRMNRSTSPRSIAAPTPPPTP